MPTTGALGSGTAFAPTPVLPKATTESGGGVVARRPAGGAVTPSEANASSGSTAAGHRPARVTPCTR